MYTHTLNFALGEDVEALRDMVRRFAQEGSRRARPRSTRANQFPNELWPELGALGLLGITADPDYGGSGMGYMAQVVAVEEISRASASVGLSYGAHSNLCVNQINRWGTRGTEGALPARLCAGDKIGALAMSESGSGSDVVSMRLKAEKRNDRYRPQRHQDVDHQRPRRRHAGGLCQDRSGAEIARHHRLHRREGDCRASRWRRSSTSSACAAPTPASWCSRMSRCRSRTCCTRKAAASRC